MNTVASSSSDDNIPQAPEGEGAPGAMLRTARIQHNLQIDQVAKELHLDARIVTAMESDDQAALPEPIFVQGYLRSYARLVGLPAEEIVRRYSAQGRPNPPPLSVIGPRRKAPMLPLPSARLTRNVILVLLAGILVWLAYPLVERLVLSRSGETEVQQPGHLDLPPVFEEEPRSDASR
jgi:cytoskeleton protein RodZ